MKKKILIILVLMVSLVGLTACKTNEINLSDYIIEERNNLFTAQDDLYTVTLSSGNREENYDLDGEVTTLVPFGVITLARNDRAPLANDSYTYYLKVNDESYTGFLIQSPVDNTYSVDIGNAIDSNAVVEIQITFTGYSFNQPMTCVSNDFAVDKTSALEIANEQLKEDVQNVMSNSNVKIEVVMKIMKDYSSESNSYYWYVGVISTNGDTLGILIDANTSEIIAKKA